MVRDTSVEAYKKIKDEGLLSERRFQVYEALYKYGPLTGMELLMKLREEGSRKSVVDSQVRARLNELRACGVARELGTRECRVTKQNVILWDVTRSLPAKFEKARRKKCPHCRGRGYLEEVQAKLF